MAITKPYNGFPPAFRDRQGKAQADLFKTGWLERPTQCKGCGLTVAEGARIHSHAENYADLFDCHGVCFSCHMAIHKRFSDIETWLTWCDLLVKGWQPSKAQNYTDFLKDWRYAHSQFLERTITPTWLKSLPLVEPDYYAQGA